MEPLAMRATLTKDGCSDVDYRVVRRDGFSFEVSINGKAHAFWPRFSPQQLINGTARPFTLRQAWEHSVAQNFAGYTVTHLRELSVDEAT